MNRLTKKHEKTKHYILTTTTGSQYGDYICEQEAIDKLADYEDIGLSPEEIKHTIKVITEKWLNATEEVREHRNYWNAEIIKQEKLSKTIQEANEQLKHRANIAEEALKLACTQLGSELLLSGVNKEIIIEPRIKRFKQQAEERLKEMEVNNGK